jgi:hypothetical protein
LILIIKGSSTTQSLLRPVEQLLENSTDKTSEPPSSSYLDTTSIMPIADTKRQLLSSASTTSTTPSNSVTKPPIAGKNVNHIKLELVNSMKKSTTTTTTTMPSKNNNNEINKPVLNSWRSKLKNIYAPEETTTTTTTTPPIKSNDNDSSHEWSPPPSTMGKVNEAKAALFANNNKNKDSLASLKSATLPRNATRFIPIEVVNQKSGSKETTTTTTTTTEKSQQPQNKNRTKIENIKFTPPPQLSTKQEEEKEEEETPIDNYKNNNITRATSSTFSSTTDRYKNKKEYDPADAIVEKACNNFMFKLIEYQRLNGLPTTTTATTTTEYDIKTPTIPAPTYYYSNDNDYESSNQQGMVTSLYSSRGYESPLFNTGSSVNSSSNIGTTGYVSAIRKRRTLFTTNQSTNSNNIMTTSLIGGDHYNNNNNHNYSNYEPNYTNSSCFSAYKPSNNDIYGESDITRSTSPSTSINDLNEHKIKMTQKCNSTSSSSTSSSPINKQSSPPKTKVKTKNSSKASTPTPTPTATSNGRKSLHCSTSGSLKNQSSTPLASGNRSLSKGTTTVAKIRSTIFDKSSNSNNIKTSTIFKSNRNLAPSGLAIKEQNEVAFVTNMTPPVAKCRVNTSTTSTTSTTTKPQPVTLNRMRSLDCKNGREKFKIGNNSPKVNKTTSGPSVGSISIPSCYLYGSSPPSPSPSNTSNTSYQNKQKSASPPATDSSSSTSSSNNSYSKRNKSTPASAAAVAAVVTHAFGSSFPVTLPHQDPRYSTPPPTTTAKSKDLETSSTTNSRKDLFDRLSKRTSSMKNLNEKSTLQLGTHKPPPPTTSTTNKTRSIKITKLGTKSTSPSTMTLTSSSNNSDQEQEIIISSSAASYSSSSSSSSASSTSSTDQIPPAIGNSSASSVSSTTSSSLKLNKNLSDRQARQSQRSSLMSKSKTSVFERLYKSNIAAHTNLTANADNTSNTTITTNNNNNNNNEDADRDSTTSTSTSTSSSTSSSSPQIVPLSCLSPNLIIINKNEK